MLCVHRFTTQPILPGLILLSLMFSSYYSDRTIRCSSACGACSRRAKARDVIVASLDRRAACSARDTSSNT
jgi:hypothetical protein